jgi:tetratricopeptide (TPR) repeat protein
VLPGRLDELALPASIDQTLDARVALLGTDARRFCQALALSSEEDPLHAQEYGELLPGVSGARLDAVFDELFSRGILVPPASSPAFVHEGLRDAVRRSIPGSEVPEVHRRVASAYRSGSAPSLVLSAYHSLEAGDTELGFAEGARAVHRRATISIRGAAFLRTEEGTRAFERLFEWGLATKKPWPDVLSIGQMLLTNAAVADARLVRHREPVIARLRLDSGLSDWEALSEIPDPVQRIQMAVGNAFMRHQSTPETERGLSPPEAIEMLCGAVAGLCGFFARRLEHTEVVALLPLLEPFRLLSPAVGAVADMLDTTVDSMVGRCVTERRKRVMRALSSPIPGLEEVPRIGMWWLNLYYQALDDACYGRPGAADPVHPLLSTAMYAPLAWDARLMAALYQGDLEGAEAARKERELSKLTRSDGAHAQLEGGFVYEVSAYDFLGDVLQLKRCLPRLEGRAHEGPATRTRYVLHLGNYYRLRGQLQKAIAAYEEALALTPSPAVSVDWAYIVMRYAHTLVDVGRAAEARDLCVRAVAEATAFGFMPRIARYMEMKLALAEAALGLSRAAAERSERIIEEAISEGIGGVHFAHLCLDQALAAQLARDEEFLERAISRLERLAANSKYPAFAMKHAHLLRLAQGRGRFQVAPNPPKPLGAWEMIPTAVAASHRTQLELCKGRGERAQRALRILLEAAASDEGYLYLIGDDGITLAASRAGSGPPASLEESLTERVRAGSVEAATTDETTQMPSLRPEAPSSYDVVEVVTDSGGRYVLAALAAMKPRNGALLPVPMTVRTTLSDALIRAGDTVAIPWT